MRLFVDVKNRKLAEFSLPPLKPSLLLKLAQKTEQVHRHRCTHNTTVDFSHNYTMTSCMALPTSVKTDRKLTKSI